MNKNLLVVIILLGFQAISFGGCGHGTEDKASRVAIKEIALAGAIAEPRAELSGLTWYKNNLILLPQYPDRFASSAYGALFFIPKSEILSSIEADAPSPIIPQKIDLNVEDLSKLIPGFEGFESLVIVGQAVYMTIEASEPAMKGYIISGTISADLSAIVLDTATLREISLNGYVANASDESITYADGKLLTFYEANGANISQAPTANVFSTNLEAETPIPFPSIEYRVTDATKVDSNGYFWIINFMFPGDGADYLPAHDSFSDTTEVIPDPAGRVERLIELRYSEEGIVATDRRPIDLVLENDEVSCNWEGLAKLDDRGFLLITDKFPKTILGFVQAHIENRM